MVVQWSQGNSHEVGHALGPRVRFPQWESLNLLVFATLSSIDALVGRVLNYSLIDLKGAHTVLIVYAPLEWHPAGLCYYCHVLVG